MIKIYENTLTLLMYVIAIFIALALAGGIGWLMVFVWKAFIHLVMTV